MEEVLVEVEEDGATSEGAFVDEFRQEQQLEKSKIKLATRKLNLSLSLFVSHTSVSVLLGGEFVDFPLLS